MVLAVLSLISRTHLQLGWDGGTVAWQVSMVGLVMSAITATLWVTTNTQLRQFTVEKMKCLICQV